MMNLSETFLKLWSKRSLKLSSASRRASLKTQVAKRNWAFCLLRQLLACLKFQCKLRVAPVGSIQTGDLAKDGVSVCRVYNWLRLKDPGSTRGPDANSGEVASAMVKPQVHPISGHAKQAASVYLIMSLKKDS